MRRLRALVGGLPAESAFRVAVDQIPVPTPGRPRRRSSVEDIEKLGGKVIRLPRRETG